MGARQEQGEVGVLIGWPWLEKAAALEKASGGRAARWMQPRQSHTYGSGNENVLWQMEKPKVVSGLETESGDEVLEGDLRVEENGHGPRATAWMGDVPTSTPSL
jgi:hypothetical protein